MHIVVTGASGRLGQAVVARLRAERVTVIAVDRAMPAHGRGHGMEMEVDLRNAAQVDAALAGADAVIHLGAIPNPLGRPAQVVYANNVLATFNVFEAAATLGIRRVVSASSVSALGFAWQHRWSEPLYAPIDEAHPLLPQDAYGLSKANGEEIAAAYCRRGAGSAASLRFSYIVDEAALRQFVAAVRADPGEQAHLLWAYVDRRDAAEACVQAATAPFEGHHALFISAADTASEVPTAVLMERYFPGVPVRHQNARDHWSVLDGTCAAQVLGFRPRYEWRAVLGQQTVTDADS
jgi:nucleoside-diphosphate-sugar epimerase